jgi:hypothetical protein
MRALQTSPSSCGSFCLRLRTALHFAGRPCCANVLAALEDCCVLEYLKYLARRAYCHRRVRRSRRPLTEKTQRALCRRDHGRSPRGKQTLTTLFHLATDQTRYSKLKLPERAHSNTRRPRGREPPMGLSALSQVTLSCVQSLTRLSLSTDSHHDSKSMLRSPPVWQRRTTRPCSWIGGVGVNFGATSPSMPHFVSPRVLACTFRASRARCSCSGGPLDAAPSIRP